MRPSATRMLSPVTCAPKQPSTWWFLPCTSAATMPPSVTNCVPGETGVKKPRGRNMRELLEREAGLGAQQAGRRIEREDAIGERRGDDRLALRAGSDESP